MRIISKHTAIFLLIAAVFGLCSNLAIELWYMLEYPERIKAFNVFSFLVFSLIPISFIALSVSLVRPGAPGRKGFALFVAIASGICLLLAAYNLYLVYSESDRILSPVLAPIHSVLTLMRFVSMSCFGILFMSKNPLRIRRAAAWLLVMAVLGIGEILAHSIYAFGTMYLKARPVEFDTINLVNSYLHLLKLCVPISLLCMAFSLLKRSGRETATAQDEVASEHLVDVPVQADASPAKADTSVAGWLREYFLAAIPVAGLVMLGIRTTDPFDRLHRNWAIALYFVRVITFGLILLVFLPYMAPKLYTWYFAEIVLFTQVHIALVAILLLAGGVLLAVRNRQVPGDLLGEQSTTGERSIGKWLLYNGLAAIPGINLICLGIWIAAGKDGQLKKWAVARLCWVGISAVLAFFIVLAVEEFLIMNAHSYAVF